MDTRKLLEELENVINSANEVPFTNKKMVDKDEIERLIDAINQSLPNELESARRIVADKERRQKTPLPRQRTISPALQKKANWSSRHRKEPMK